MADFKQALTLVLQHEGGYSNDPDDPGGETYKGVARNMNSNWVGWTLIDLQKKQSNFPANLANNAELNAEIEQFYKINYWDKVSGGDITDQRVANAIFDFGVNAGTGISIILAQRVAGVKEEDVNGVMKEDSVTAINAMNPDHFLAYFTLAKIARYIKIVKKRPSSQKYFYGWIRRALGDN